MMAHDTPMMAHMSRLIPSQSSLLFLFPTGGYQITLSPTYNTKVGNKSFVTHKWVSNPVVTHLQHKSGQQIFLSPTGGHQIPLLPTYKAKVGNKH